MAERKKLSDILLNSDRDRIGRLWESTKAAEDLKPIPSGEYRCALVNGEPFSARSGTPGYKLTFEVIEGEFSGRRVWHDIWFSEAAILLAKRDLAKLGVTNLDQLERPMPEGIIVAAKVALRQNDDKTEFNRVVRFEVVGTEPPEPDPFAPSPNDEGNPPDGVACLSVDADGFDWKGGRQTL
jgi:hypothetical protein